MIHLIERPATPQQIQDMLHMYPLLIKIVVVHLFRSPSPP